MKKPIWLAIVFALLLLPPIASAQPWWNTSWLYRAPINITNNNLRQTLEQGYSVKINR